MSGWCSFTAKPSRLIGEKCVFTARQWRRVLFALSCFRTDVCALLYCLSICGFVFQKSCRANERCPNAHGEDDRRERPRPKPHISKTKRSSLPSANTTPSKPSQQSLPSKPLQPHQPRPFTARRLSSSESLEPLSASPQPSSRSIDITDRLSDKELQDFFMFEFRTSMCTNLKCLHGNTSMYRCSKAHTRSGLRRKPEVISLNGTALHVRVILTVMATTVRKHHFRCVSS